MVPKKLEEYCDKSIERIDAIASEHHSGNIEDKKAQVAAGVNNSLCRSVQTCINVRRQAVREALATA